MSIRKVGIKLSVLAGLLIAPAVWTINMQLSQILPYIDCRQQQRYSAIASFVALAAACFAAAVSWGWARHARYTAPLTNKSGFSASISALASLVFAFALLLQGIASLVLSGCER
jgi:hypothetical protein